MSLEINTIPAASLDEDHIQTWADIRATNPGLDNPCFHSAFTRITGTVCPNTEVGVIKKRGEIRGFFPFERVSNHTGRAVCAEMSDFHGLITRPDEAIDLRVLLRGCRLSSWGFDHLPADQHSFREYHHNLDDSPYMDLQDGYDRYLEQKKAEGSSVIRQAERKARKIAREVGPLRFVWHDDDVALTDLLVEWKANQLIQKNYANVFALSWLTPLIKRFHQSKEAGFCGVQSVLYAGDQPIAIHSGFLGMPVFSSWIPAYNADFSRYSPGLILHLELARKATELGVARIDLCRGYNQLKRSLMSGAFPVAIGTVTSNALRQRYINGVQMAKAHLTAAPAFLPLRNLYHRYRSWKFSLS